MVKWQVTSWISGAVFPFFFSFFFSFPFLARGKPFFWWEGSYLSYLQRAPEAFWKEASDVFFLKTRQNYFFEKTRLTFFFFRSFHFFEKGNLFFVFFFFAFFSKKFLVRFQKLRMYSTSAAVKKKNCNYTSFLKVFHKATEIILKHVTKFDTSKYDPSFVCWCRILCLGFVNSD